MPEIARFGPLASLHQGINGGEIHLINGTVLSGIDEVRAIISWNEHTPSDLSRKIILATGYIRSNLLSHTGTECVLPMFGQAACSWVPLARQMRMISRYTGRGI